MKKNTKEQRKCNINLRILSDFLDKKMQWRYAREEFQGRYHLVGDVVGGKRNIQRYSFKFDILDEGVFSIAAYPFIVPETRTKDICELVVRINNKMWDGKFDYIIDRGKIQFRLFQDFDLQQSQIMSRLTRFVNLPILILNRFLDSFEDVLNKKSSPSEAIKKGLFPNAG
jgi:hypothetical protein